jgi:hypothetical protein
MPHSTRSDTTSVTLRCESYEWKLIRVCRKKQECISSGDNSDKSVGKLVGISAEMSGFMSAVIGPIGLG